jgi:hypothetical protein
MKPQRPTRERAPARPGKREPRGNTHAARDGQPEPRLPHEHDQSSDSQVLGNEQARKLMRQAASAVDRGLVDTDRGAVTERLAREHFGADAPVPRKRRR